MLQLQSCRGGSAKVLMLADTQGFCCRFDEAPPVLQFNPYVRSGYRAGMSPQQCLCSMFQYHNETGARARCTTLPLYCSADDFMLADTRLTA